MKSEKVDVIVVGGGSAAFEAAVASRQAGAERVVMLETAPASESGGSARFSRTGFRFGHAGAEEIREFLTQIEAAKFRCMHMPAYTEEDFIADLNRVTQGRIDSFLGGLLVKKSNGAVHWMLDLGIKWEPERSVELDGQYYFE